jgi:DNA replication protein DnaC
VVLVWAPAELQKDDERATQLRRDARRASTVLTSNRPVDDWGKLLGDTAAVTPLLDRLLHHAHVLKCGPRSWRTKVHPDLRQEEAAT